MAAKSGSEHHNVARLKEAKAKVLDFIRQGLDLPQVHHSPNRLNELPLMPLLFSFSYLSYEVEPFPTTERSIPQSASNIKSTAPQVFGIRTPTQAQAQAWEGSGR